MLHQSARRALVKAETSTNQPVRGTIPARDYALMDGDKIRAVVERKTLDNLLTDFGTMPALHQRLAELAAHDNHALVIEAPNADFLNPKKVHHYTPGFCTKPLPSYTPCTVICVLSFALTGRLPASGHGITSRLYGT
jgi:hypothetical protein